MALSQIRRNLFRRKQIDKQSMVSKLDRCLTTFDLTALGKLIDRINRRPLAATLP
jgi:hypothetical protein